ncbi:MAG: acyl-CoA dehydrogenase family protein, partial [Cyclobacteriaceae bacterium]
ERENGFKIAVNILNIGRIKLAVAAVGGSKKTISTAVNYAKERKQFGTAIANFGAIKHKIAEMATRIYACESACYRAGQNIDDAQNALIASGMDSAKAKLKSLEDFAIECAIMKVHGSEVLDFVVDEGVQIYGGMGFSAEGPMDRAYRDARINRIFEGTNEINRILTIDMLLKRAMKGQLDLMNSAMAVQKELMAIPDFGNSDESGIFAKEKKALQNLKKAGLMVAGAAVQKFMTKLADEQEILMNLADMLIEAYVAESTLLRVEKLISIRGEANCQIEKEMAIIYLHTAIERALSSGKEAIYGFAEGDELRLMILGLKRFTKIDPYNLKAARRKVANYVIDKGQYPF